MTRSKHIKHGASRTINGKVIRLIPKSNVRFLPANAEIIDLCNGRLRVKLDEKWVKSKTYMYRKLVREQ